MKIRSALCLLLLFGCLSFAIAGEEKEAPKGDQAWEWTPAELKKIDALEKQLAKKGKDAKGFWVYEPKKSVEESMYTVKSDISARFTAELALYLDLFMEAYPKLFPMPPRAAKMNCQYLVIVFKDRAGYQNFLISQGAGSAAGWSGGVHWADWMPREGGWPRLYVMTFPWTEGQTDINGFNRGVLQHEGAHAMLRRFVGRLENGVYDMPTAFNEGMACYFECWNLRQDIPTNRKERSARSEHWPFLKRWAAENSDWQPDLRALLDIKDEYGWAPDGGGPNTHLNYALSETLIDYLTSTPKLRATFKAMIQNMYARKPLLTAKELAAMEPEWRKHIKMLIETTPDVPAGARLTLKTERKEGKVVGWRIEGAALPEAVLEAVNAGIREALAADPTLSDEVLQKALDETLAKIRNTKEEKAPEETKKTDDPAPPKDKKK